MGFFDTVDKGLGDGGGLGLDALGLIPGVNIITEGAQGLYHGAHAVADLAEGNTEGAMKEGGSALWHTGLAALNAFTGEGGEAAELAADGAKAAVDVGEAAEGASAASTLAEGTEAAASAGEAAEGGGGMLSSLWNATGGKAISEVGEKGLSGAMMGDFTEMANAAGKSNSAGLGLLAAGKMSGEVLDIGADTTSAVINDSGLAGKQVEVPGTGELAGMIGGAMVGAHGPTEGGEHETAEGEHEESTQQVGTAPGTGEHEAAEDEHEDATQQVCR